MSIAYTWKIDQMACSPQLDQNQDVVITVYWRLTAVDEAYTASINGSMSLIFESNSSFTPYEQLTEDQVIGWVTNNHGPNVIDQMKDSLSHQINQLKNPPVIIKPLPWLPQSQTSPDTVIDPATSNNDTPLPGPV